MISNYTDLVIEATRRSGIASLPERQSDLIGMAEKDLSARLRLPEMITQAQVTSDAQGIGNLPDDFIEISYVKVATRNLVRRPSSQATAGRGNSYAIIGPKLHSSYADTDHDCSYYAALPGLEDNQTNWLLRTNPELYLYAIMFQAYTSQNDIEKAMYAGNYRDALIKNANNQAKAESLANSRIVFAGPAP